MKFNVTFYTNTLELITERKSNFTNKLAKITSNAISSLGDKMGQEYGISGTCGEKIAEALRQISIYDDFIILIPHPFTDFNYNNKIPVSFNFTETSDSSIYLKSNGVCRFLPDKEKVHPFEIKINVTFNKKNRLKPRYVIDELQNTLVHEIAHAYDEFFSKDFFNGSKSQMTNKVEDKNLNYLLYILEPSEIRSHMNQALQMYKRNAQYTHNRKVKNEFKHAHGEYGEDVYTPDFKDFFREENKKPKNSKNTFYYYLKNIIQTLYKNTCSEQLLNFCLMYHIAFVRDYNETMNKRYYIPMFKDINIAAPSLSKMNNLLNTIKEIHLLFEQSKEKIDEKLTQKGYSSQEYKMELSQLDTLINSFWNSNGLETALKDLNTDNLKKSTNALIMNFKKQHNSEW